MLPVTLKSDLWLWGLCLCLDDIFWPGHNRPSLYPRQRHLYRCQVLCMDLSSQRLLALNETNAKNFTQPVISAG